ncbi:cytochrome-c peroxidase [Sulfuriflexus mobilis]|uniref:cytochrome-c peroxidase n=1 Tax=Sulfuriflexus mobilis TaxID=1811807 RepID=UPI0018D530B9|nr:cytochrome c peroxidase [Sulfuriflexus mobilis]
MNNKKMNAWPVTLSTIALILTSTIAYADKSYLPSPVVDSDYYEDGKPSAAKVKLGKFLFYDKILSGNNSISCATCHHALTATGDGLSLGTGEGARGLGVTRDTGTGAEATDRRIPRNAQPIFNLGAKSFTAMFHAGRVEVDPSQASGFRTEVGDDLPPNLENVLAVQAMFPVTVNTTMSGHAGENAVADAALVRNLNGPGGVWELLSDRLRNIPEYVEMFKEAFGVEADEINFVHASNAMAAFQGVAWRADNSPFDKYLRGNKKAMSRDAIKGMRLFYGKANCATCHSGKFQTDNQYHAIAMPQIGPGRGDGFDGHEDIGREKVTGDPQDRYRFRTPSLRNVVLTGPWGHGGAFNTIEGIVNHHLDPVTSIQNYDCRNEPVMPSRPDLDALDCIVQDDPSRVAAIASANELAPVELDDEEKRNLIDFLHALTDTDSLDLRADVPKYLPSGLPLAE